MASTPHFRIGTRGSDLAQWQARHVRDLIQSKGGSCEIIILSTQGDREQVQAFEKLEGKGFFTKEIEQALLENKVDLAVHSHKDLETIQPEGLTIAAVPQRANPTDVLLIHPDAHALRPWLPLPKNAKVGTSSVRRRDQLLLLRPDLDIQALRGNVPTRIERLRKKNYDAIVLASAGIERLELDLGDLIQVELNPRWFVPAPAQGALALQMRSKDPQLGWLQALSNEEAEGNIEMERSVLRALEGGCQLPFGAHHSPGENGLRCFLQSSLGPLRVVAKDSLSALERLANPSSQRILITRTPRGSDVLKRLAQATTSTLIEWPVARPKPSETDLEPMWNGASPNWVWLGSPGAVTMALPWLHDHPNARIAVPGSGTASALPIALQARIGHCGTGDPKAAWRSFAQSLGTDDHVAIPHSSHSLKRWTETPCAAHLHSWVHYELEAASETPPDFDVVCFTSPSNVELWTWPPPSKIVAIGKTTSRSLTQKGWSHIVASQPDAFGLWEAIAEA